jgi:hypothetical protein
MDICDVCLCGIVRLAAVVYIAGNGDIVDSRVLKLAGATVNAFQRYTLQVDSTFKCDDQFLTGHPCYL